ncbi:hypothetical protein QA641_13785 [Bradyrhizobium sp. CB1650]|nr:hypothetical protein [Bradyrhizobium sp. CB1650]WGD54888.1 hypothetical protein QA641_13785 [Bradyrhizobium sp. CB1650]
MTSFFWRKSPMEKLEAELASMRPRADTLNSRHTDAALRFVREISRGFGL